LNYKMVQQPLSGVRVQLDDRASISLLWHRASAVLARQGSMGPLIRALAACSELTDAINTCASECQTEGVRSALSQQKSNGRASRSGNNSSDATNKSALATLLQALDSLDMAWPRSLHRDAVDSYAAYLRGPIAAAVQGARHFDPAFAPASAELVRRAQDVTRAARESLVCQRLQHIKSSPLARELVAFIEDQESDQQQQQQQQPQIDSQMSDSNNEVSAGPG
jgi:hypothetical protein